jgi:hypothetical protein
VPAPHGRIVQPLGDVELDIVDEILELWVVATNPRYLVFILQWAELSDDEERRQLPTAMQPQPIPGRTVRISVTRLSVSFADFDRCESRVSGSLSVVFSHTEPGLCSKDTSTRASLLFYITLCLWREHQAQRTRVRVCIREMKSRPRASHLLLGSDSANSSAAAERKHCRDGGGK